MLELLAGCLALKLMDPHCLVGAEILWFTDNMVILQALRKSYSMSNALNDAILHWHTLLRQRKAGEELDIRKIPQYKIGNPFSSILLALSPYSFTPLSKVAMIVQGQHHGMVPKHSLYPMRRK